MINFISWIIFGFIAGAIARFLLPGRDAMGCITTIIIGVIGSFVGGYLGSLFRGGPSDSFHPAGLLGAIIGSIIVLLIYRKLFAPPRV